MSGEFSQNYKRIGRNVSALRRQRGMTQEQLAEKMGVETSFIGQIEAPNMAKSISLDTLFRLARALGVPPAELVDF